MEKRNLDMSDAEECRGRWGSAPRFQGENSCAPATLGWETFVKSPVDGIPTSSNPVGSKPTPTDLYSQTVSVDSAAVLLP